MGDSVMAIFKRPADAIYAALDMQSIQPTSTACVSRAWTGYLAPAYRDSLGRGSHGNVGTARKAGLDRDW